MDFQLSKYLPMKTAPKDGTIIASYGEPAGLVFSETERRVRFNGANWVWINPKTGEDIKWNGLYWRPLKPGEIENPEPPVEVMEAIKRVETPSTPHTTEERPYRKGDFRAYLSFDNGMCKYQLSSYHIKGEGDRESAFKCQIIKELAEANFIRNLAVTISSGAYFNNTGVDVTFRIELSRPVNAWDAKQIVEQAFDRINSGLDAACKEYIK